MLKGNGEIMQLQRTPFFVSNTEQLVNNLDKGAVIGVQASDEPDYVFWYFHFAQNLTDFVLFNTIKSFSVIDKTQNNCGVPTIFNDLLNVEDQFPGPFHLSNSACSSEIQRLRKLLFRRFIIWKSIMLLGDNGYGPINAIFNGGAFLV